MSDKQALNATFFAFRKREKAGVLTAATIAYAVIAIAMTALFAAANWQAVGDYMNWAMTMDANKVDPNDPNAFAQMMPPASVMSIGPAYLLFMAAAYVLFAAYETACLRWMIHGETAGIFGLSLGADTWRVYFGYWLWLIIGIAAYIAIVVLTFGTIGAVVLSGQANPDALGPGVLIGLLLFCAILFAWLYVAIRLAPAAAASVARRRFAFFDAWKVTKGRFWAMFGSFALLFLMYFVLCIAGGVAIGVAVGATALGQMSQTDPQSAQEAMRAMMASPPLIAGFGLLYGVLIIAAFAFYLAMFGVNARAASLALEEGKIAAGA